ncbi:MAG: TrkH family potassium uptake protein [Candidatus Wallbacteria bacterium]|nr:TrkH family potassium uptake protein [Candidatus Wallbacteria bacterium]
MVLCSRPSPEIKFEGGCSLREREYLKQRYSLIASSVGKILLCSGLVMLLPLLVLPSFPEDAIAARSFWLPAVCLFLLGFALHKRFRCPSDIPLTIQEGGIIVLLSWVVVILFSAWPFASALNLAYSRALFESVSGWTTTGLSVVDVTQAGKMILIWRSIIQFAGGAGWAIIMMSAISGPVGVGISSAEGRSDQLVPHVRRSARLVLAIYICYAIVGIVAYWAAGMSYFDAVNHSFAAVSTGGFSTRVESIGYWDSPAIEAISLPLMILGNLSFVTAWFIWSGRFRTAARNGEVRLLALIILIASSALFILTCRTIYPQLGKSVRVAVFETVTAITTTGFSTVGYGNWNAFGLFLMIIMMMIGGGTCSTAGGIKQFRVYLLWRMICREIRRHIMPGAAVVECPVWEGDKRVFLDDTRMRHVLVFISLYIATYLLGVLILCGCGYTLSDSLFEFASALGTVGLSVGVTSASMADTALWTMIIAMLLGRLEFIVVIVSMMKIFSDCRQLMSKTLKSG